MRTRIWLQLVRNALALLLLVVATAFGQGGRPGGNRPQGPPSPAMEVARLARTMADEGVPLSDTQQSSLLAVYQDAQTAAKSEAASSGDDATRRTNMQALQARVRKAVRALLTEAQAKVFDAMRGPGGRGGSGTDSGPPSGGGGPPSSSDAPQPSNQ